MNRFTARINISSLLVATMSICACLLMLDSQAFAQAAVASTANEDQSRQHAGVNLLPLAEVVNRILTSPDAGESSNFEFLIEGDRDAEGLLSNVTIKQISGDAKLKQTGDEFVAALNDSHVLSFLSEAKRLRLQIISSKAEVAVIASYMAESAERASVVGHGYNALFYSAASVNRGRDYEQMYRSLKAFAHGSEVAITFSMSRETFCALLSKYLSSN
jgi:hypothetical protein